jgi:phage I-like protein
MAQRYEMEAWLGDDHGLTNEQVDQFTTAATEIEARYPDEDDQDERDAALIAAHRLMTEDPRVVVKDVAAELTRARVAVLRALAEARQCAITLVVDDGQGIESESGFAREIGVGRSSVREWLGKRRR